MFLNEAEDSNLFRMIVHNTENENLWVTNDNRGAYMSGDLEEDLSNYSYMRKALNREREVNGLKMKETLAVSDQVKPLNIDLRRVQPKGPEIEENGTSRLIEYLDLNKHAIVPARETVEKEDQFPPPKDGIKRVSKETISYFENQYPILSKMTDLDVSPKKNVPEQRDKTRIVSSSGDFYIERSEFSSPIDLSLVRSQEYNTGNFLKCVSIDDKKNDPKNTQALCVGPGQTETLTHHYQHHSSSKPSENKVLDPAFKFLDSIQSKLDLIRENATNRSLTVTRNNATPFGKLELLSDTKPQHTPENSVNSFGISGMKEISSQSPSLNKPELLDTLKLDHFLIKNINQPSAFEPSSIKKSPFKLHQESFAIEPKSFKYFDERMTEGFTEYSQPTNLQEDILANRGMLINNSESLLIKNHHSLKSDDPRRSVITSMENRERSNKIEGSAPKKNPQVQPRRSTSKTNKIEQPMNQLDTILSNLNTFQSNISLDIGQNLERRMDFEKKTQLVDTIQIINDEKQVPDLSDRYKHEYTSEGFLRRMTKKAENIPNISRIIEFGPGLNFDDLYLKPNNILPLDIDISRKKLEPCGQEITPPQTYSYPLSFEAKYIQIKGDSLERDKNIDDTSRLITNPKIGSNYSVINKDFAFNQEPSEKEKSYKKVEDDGEGSISFEAESRFGLDFSGPEGAKNNEVSTEREPIYGNISDSMHFGTGAGAEAYLENSLYAGNSQFSYNNTTKLPSFENLDIIADSSRRESPSQESSKAKPISFNDKDLELIDDYFKLLRNLYSKFVIKELHDRFFDKKDKPNVLSQHSRNSSYDGSSSNESRRSSRRERALISDEFFLELKIVLKNFLKGEKKLENPDRLVPLEVLNEMKILLKSYCNRPDFHQETNNRSLSTSYGNLFENLTEISEKRRPDVMPLPKAKLGLGRKLSEILQNKSEKLLHSTSKDKENNHNIRQRISRNPDFENENLGDNTDGRPFRKSLSINDDPLSEVSKSNNTAAYTQEKSDPVYIKNATNLNKNSQEDIIVTTQSTYFSGEIQTYSVQSDQKNSDSNKPSKDWKTFVKKDFSSGIPEEINFNLDSCDMYSKEKDDSPNYRNKSPNNRDCSTKNEKEHSISYVSPVKKNNMQRKKLVLEYLE